MSTPVLIAAYNEEAYIGRTLKSLDPGEVEPLVLVNGSTDATADIARYFGATTLESDESGKLPALQQGLRHLGKRALGPVLYLDSDSYPLSPRAWSRAMTGRLQKDAPSVVSGMTSLGDASIPESVLRTAKRATLCVKAKLAGDASATFGANMATRLAEDDVLQEVLEMPHIWPGEDIALVDLVGGHGTFEQSIDPRTYVHMSARSLPPLSRRLSAGKREAARDSHIDYLRRAAPGVTHAYIAGKLITKAEALEQ